MTFPVVSSGRVLYIQLDNPGTTWSCRIKTFREHGYHLRSDKVFHADSTTLPYYPFDILQPLHRDYLKSVIEPLEPTLVVIDTLRKVHTGDENSSTVMSNVISSLYAAVSPSALLVISHDKKPSPDLDKDIIADHRGSTSVVGEMDAIIRLTKTRMYYAGRNVEADHIKLQKHVIESEDDSTIIWEPDPQENNIAIVNVLADSSLNSMRAKARVLAQTVNINEEAALSRIRRIGPKLIKIMEKEAREKGLPIPVYQLPSSLLLQNRL